VRLVAVPCMIFVDQWLRKKSAARIRMTKMSVTTERT
jgi:hypothetical protein